MKLSMFSAVYVAITTYLCARLLAPEWLFLGFFSSYLWGMPLVYRVYMGYKKRHSVENGAGKLVNKYDTI